jgi:hypothetical protein
MQAWSAFLFACIMISRGSLNESARYATENLGVTPSKTLYANDAHAKLLHRFS